MHRFRLQSAVGAIALAASACNSCQLACGGERWPSVGPCSAALAQPPVPTSEPQRHDGTPPASTRGNSGSGASGGISA